MFRKMTLIAPLLAFALPFVLTSTSEARPLATPTQEAEWCWGDCGDDDGDNSIFLQVCFAAQIEFDHRDYECSLAEGPACVASCTAEAVRPLCLSELGDRATPRALNACEAERMGTCRNQCDTGGAALCSPKVRWDDRDDGGGDDNNDIVFIDIEVCVSLELDHR